MLVGSGALSVICLSALDIETRVEKVVGAEEVGSLPLQKPKLLPSACLSSGDGSGQTH